MKTKLVIIIFMLINARITLSINKKKSSEQILLLDIKKNDCQKSGNLWNEAIKQCIPNININHDEINTSQELKKQECFAKNQFYVVKAGEIGKCYKKQTKKTPKTK